MGGYLAAITSAEEDAFLAEMKADQGLADSPVWIGGSDSLMEGIWQWDSGEAWTYANWALAEPVGGTMENFLVMWSNGQWKDWADVAENIGHFFCEKQGAIGSPPSP